jgi:hypothetical protein
MIATKTILPGNLFFQHIPLNSINIQEGMNSVGFVAYFYQRTVTIASLIVAWIIAYSRRHDVFESNPFALEIVLKPSRCFFSIVAEI